MKIVKIFKTIEHEAGLCNEKRYVIADDNGKILDDAQGYGYKTYENASKALWWKFKNGKNQSYEKLAWWKKHKDLWHEIQEMIVLYWKDITYGDIDDKTLIVWSKDIAKEKFNLDLPDEMIKFAFTKSGSKLLDKNL